DSKAYGIPPSPTKLVMLYWTFTISQMSGNVLVKSISVDPHQFSYGQVVASSSRWKLNFHLP
ncbi:MAG: hypothetical protein LW859_04115, partial [Anabaena sp. 49633_E8]|nr:hypothetical protein [Anabaena sp. 49633_E8]